MYSKDSDQIGMTPGIKKENRHQLCTYSVALANFLPTFRQIGALIENIFLSSYFNICFGGQKKRFTETVPLTTHKICLGCELNNDF